MSKDGMKYETTNIKKTSSKAIVLHDMDVLGTSTILWYVVKRHKTGLLGAWAITITLLYIFPPLPDLLLSLIS